MNKIIGLMFSLCAFAIHASIHCPATITCNLDTNSCNSSLTWQLDFTGATEAFTGNQTFPISKISAIKNSAPYDLYQMNCTYNYGNYSAVTIHAFVKELKGENWVFDFGKQTANCSRVASPESCSGGI